MSGVAGVAAMMMIVVNVDADLSAFSVGRGLSIHGGRICWNVIVMCIYESLSINVFSTAHPCLGHQCWQWLCLYGVDVCHLPFVRKLIPVCPLSC